MLKTSNRTERTPPDKEQIHGARNGHKTNTTGHERMKWFFIRFSSVSRVWPQLQPHFFSGQVTRSQFTSTCIKCPFSASNWQLALLETADSKEGNWHFRLFSMQDISKTCKSCMYFCMLNWKKILIQALPCFMVSCCPPAFFSKPRLFRWIPFHNFVWYHPCKL